MRNKVRRMPRLGDERVVKKFALFPVCLNGEFAWFETVYIRQCFVEHEDDMDGTFSLFWMDEEFAGPTNKCLSTTDLVKDSLERTFISGPGAAFFTKACIFGTIMLGSLIRFL